MLPSLYVISFVLIEIFPSFSHIQSGGSSIYIYLSLPCFFFHKTQIFLAIHLLFFLSFYSKVFILNFFGYLFLFHLIPCFSLSCNHTLPCNKSIEIYPPFFYSDETNHSCRNSSKIEIVCVRNIPTIYPFNITISVDNNTKGYSLENISYQNKTLRLQDPDMARFLSNATCENFLLNPTRKNFSYSYYSSLSTTLSSVKCGLAANQTSSNYHYEKLLPGCSEPKNASFEWILSFNNASKDLVLESAVFNVPSFLSECSGVPPKHPEKNTYRAIKIIIAGVAGGIFIMFLTSCGCILYFKRKKWKSVSASKKLLINRGGDVSDPYRDLEFMAASQNTQIFSYEELEEATDCFDSGNELGEGSFGTVYKGKLRDGKTVAVKKLYKNSYRRVKQFLNEVEILSHLCHPNLVTLYGCTARTSHELLLVYEYIANGTVADHLHGPQVNDQSLTWPIRLNIAIETAQALSFLHSIEPQIIHRDVKTTNILLDDGFHVKVGDFGLSRLFPTDMTHVSTVPQGTPGYVDPVYHQCYQLTEKSDVYSFGVVLIELISSKPAVDMSRISNEINLANLALNKIQRSELAELVDPVFGYETDWEMRKMVSLVAELAFRCLQSEREMRPSIKEVLLAVQKEGFGNSNEGGENKGEKSLVREESESCLLRNDMVDSPDTVIERWTSRTTTPNTSV